MGKHLFALLVAAGVVLAARVAPATVLVPVDLPELSRSAQAIVRGRVVAVEARWADGRSRIESLVTVAAVEYLKGDLGPTVAFKIPGGEMGRYRSVMVGAPSFREGDEVVLFLGARGPSFPFLLGLGQGVYRLTREAATGRPVVIPPAIDGRRAGGTVVRGDPGRRPVPLDEFTSRVRSLVAGGTGARAVPRASRGR